MNLIYRLKDYRETSGFPMNKLMSWAKASSLVCKISPLEYLVLGLSFVSILGCLTLVATNRLDLVIIWAGDVYEALPKVFK